MYGQGIFTHDVSPPQSEIGTVGFFNNPDTWPGLVGSASDLLSGVASVEITLQRALDDLYYNGSSWSPTVTWLRASGTTSWSFPFTPAVETRYTVNSKATDGCGNVQSVPGTGAFTYDTTAPGPPFNLSVMPSNWSKFNSFNLSWNNPADRSGIVAAHYKWDTAPINNDDESSGSPAVGEGINHISGLTVATQGTHQLFLWLEDMAGNVNFQTRNATSAGAFKWDAVPPATSLVGLVATQGCAGWYTSTVLVSLSAVDVNPDPERINATSGISATFWRQDGGSWQRLLTSTFEIAGEGPHTVEYYSEDRAGNLEIIKAVSPAVKIDTVLPTTNQPYYTGTLGRNGWYTSTVSVALTAVDATSGVSATYHQVDGAAFELDNLFNVATDGVHTIRYYSVDAACNQEMMQTTSTPLKIDKTSPTTSYQRDGRLGENGWFIASPVTMTLRANDAVTGVQTSGMDRLRYRIDGGSWQEYSGAAVSFAVTTPPGQSEYVRLIEYSAMDLAGNIEPTRALTVGIDFRAPPAIPFVPIVSPPSWTRTNCFTITWDENPYDLSGIGGAYYSFREPVSPTDGILILSHNIKSIPCVQIPVELGDGARNVYIWLRDEAGNSDHRTRREVTVRLDQTPPRVTPDVTGNLCGTSGWYNSPITVCFAAADNVPSGMVGGVISYHVVSAGGWVEGNCCYESRDGRHTIEGRAMDAAGNVSGIVTTTVKLDRTPPAAPIGLSVEPSGWSKDNLFTTSWVNPGDFSGLAGAYYKQGGPPIAPTDGVYVDNAQGSLSISATSEGEIPVYVWLVDKACNSDHQRRAIGILKYDRTMPTTTFSASGTLGGDGWYVSLVRITLNCEDNASGWASSYYRIGNGPWQNGTSFLIDTEGTTTFSYYSMDAAGNVESARTGLIKIDSRPPSSYAYADSYSQSSCFTIYWDGSDASSGIAAFDIQYRVGTTGAWQDWVISVDPAQRSRLFCGTVGKTFYFRTRARDRAGNVESYASTPEVYVSADPLLNGDFGHGDWNGWERSWVSRPWWHGAECPPTLVVTQSYTGGDTWTAVLGCPGQRDGPVGTAMICQTINVPNAQDWPAPVLLFRYHILTYDVLWGPTKQKFYDSFNVGLYPPGAVGPTYVFTDGNRTATYGQLLDLGWREGAVDLRPYAGRTTTICLANVTREDEGDAVFNTWTLVDDVKLVNLEHRLYVPMVLGVTHASELSAGLQQVLTYPNLKADTHALRDITDGDSRGRSHAAEFPGTETRPTIFGAER